jgi:hypothetical protein
MNNKHSIKFHLVEFYLLELNNGLRESASIPVGIQAEVLTSLVNTKEYCHNNY